MLSVVTMMAYSVQYAPFIFHIVISTLTINNFVSDYNYTYTNQLYVYTQINDEYSSLIVAQLLYLQSEDPKLPINMYINSPGQSEFSSLSN